MIDADDDNRITLKPLEVPDHQECDRDYINASYVDVGMAINLHDCASRDIDCPLAHRLDIMHALRMIRCARSKK